MSPAHDESPKLVINPAATVRWEGQTLVLAGFAEGPEATAQDAAVLALLHAFAQPSTFEEAVARAGYRDGEEAREIVSDLRQAGVLVPPGRVATPSPLPAPAGHYEQLRQRARRRWEAMPYLRFDDARMTVSSCGKQQLSPGCISCKEGGWICFYAGFACPAAGAVCPQSTEQKALVEPDGGLSRVDVVLAAAKASAHRVTGISISGGDPALYPDLVGRLASSARRDLPGVHLWAYTSGLSLSPEEMARWAGEGVDELRVNLSASGFAPAVMKKVAEHAVRLFRWVTVEVPATAETREHLVTRGRLAELSAAGVKQLNLCEVIIPADKPDCPAYRNHVGDGALLFEAPPEYGPAWTLGDSRQVTCDVFEHAHAKGLGIRINDCSLDAKLAQGLSRQVRWGDDYAPILRAAFPPAG
ncbi:MAG: hypothetical protein HY901_02765 [Deltaproteobacteria bacterium]|nr:hypothetical protein [Deltaproteobacteria bacterium]